MKNQHIFENVSHRITVSSCADGFSYLLRIPLKIKRNLEYKPAPCCAVVCIGTKKIRDRREEEEWWWNMDSEWSRKVTVETLINYFNDARLSSKKQESRAILWKPHGCVNLKGNCGDPGITSAEDDSHCPHRLLFVSIQGPLSFITTGTITVWTSHSVFAVEVS